MNFDVFTRPSTWAFRDGEWTVAVGHGVVGWTVFNSPSVFTHNNTIEDFTSVELHIIVGITFGLEDDPMISFKIVTLINNTIIIGIKTIITVFSDFFDVITGPSSVTLWATVWVRTVKWFNIWANFGSPFVFSIEETVIDFRFTDVTIHVLVTFRNEHI